MKKILLLLLTALTGLAAAAQKTGDVNKAVVNVIAYDAEGNILSNTNGFLYSPANSEGNVVAAFHALKGARRAEIIDWKGQRADVLRIYGASSEYDLVKMTTAANMKKGLSLWSDQATATVGETLSVAYYTTDKKALPETTAVTAADSYNGHYYYELSLPNEQKYFGCPLVNAAGQVVAVVQQNVQQDATTACAIDVNFVNDFTVNVMSAINNDLNAIGIAKTLPAADDDIRSFLYLLLHSPQDATIVETMTGDYLSRPDADPRVYAERATYYVSLGDYAKADADLQQGLARARQATGDNAALYLAEILHTQSLLMHAKALATDAAADPWPSWTLATALESSKQACTTLPQPAYQLQRGQVLFSQERYADAYADFSAVNATDIASHQTFYYAATALQQMGGEETAVIALLDSAVSRLATPYTAEAAPYLLERAQHLVAAGQHRKATADYNAYEKIIGPSNLNAYFYYLRMQSEVGSRMYQQALDDAQTAIVRAADDDERCSYLIEQALLQAKVGMLDECLATCQTCLLLRPDNADAYKISGIAYGEKKQKSRAVECLKKAAELGAENTEPLLQKYK